MKHPPVVPPPALRHLPNDLATLDAEGLLRFRPNPRGATRLSFCSNDYLGLADTLIQGTEAPLGAGASRLVCGEHEVHQRLEQSLCRWLQLPSALVISSGFAANAGTLPALVGAEDLVISDALNHASIIDGCRLSKASVRVVPHLDLEAIETTLRASTHRRRWVVTETYFSMDADTPDLKALKHLCETYDAALMVDEAHALGVFGEEGRGLCHDAGVIPDVFVGTFGKAMGASGAFVGGCTALTDWLWNRCRSFVFSTGVSPLLAESIVQTLPAVVHGDALRKNLHANAAALRQGLTTLGFEAVGYGPIVPCLVGDARAAVALAQRLREEGVDVRAIRPPTVPPGTARLRFSVTANHSQQDIATLLEALRRGA